MVNSMLSCRTRHRLELRKFKDDLNMADLVEQKRATIEALIDHIGQAYKTNVMQNWLPRTAQRVLQAWSEGCEELGQTCIGMLPE